MSLKNKRILITAGPTWVSIDSVRVISNTATGSTGILLAEKLQYLGAKVTLLLGPVGYCCLNKKIKLLSFKFFTDLKKIIIKELKSKKYDIVIHSAAVSDYKPQAAFTKKVKSDRKIWKLVLVPTAKIIDSIKKTDRSVFLVGFKFDTDTTKYRLIKETKQLIARADLDLAVANTNKDKQYQAYIVSRRKTYGPFLNKNYLTKELIKVMGDVLWQK